MKTRLKHLLFAAVPYWIVQLVVLLTGYTDSRVILQMYLPMFVVTAALLLTSQFFAGHGLWLGAAAGLAAEYVQHLSRGDRPNMGGAFMNMAILILCAAVGILLQLLVNARKKKKEKEMEG